MNIKRILSGILTTCVLSASFLSALPVSAQTTTEVAHSQVVAEQQNNVQIAGSSTNEFVINNKKDFSKFMTTSKYWGSNYKIKLNCDISWIFFKKFNPIEDFKGDFDGGGHTIKYVMLRCFVKNNHGTISRLNFQKSKLLSTECGFVENNYGTISECTSNGAKCVFGLSVKGENDVGGFVKYNQGVITNCTAIGDVHGSNSLGGFVGFNSGKINNCKAEGNVTACSYEHMCIVYWWAGGFAGKNAGEITNCTATGNVNGEIIGGFVGVNYGKITNCIAKGKVIGDYDIPIRFAGQKAGGFAGKNEGSITNCSATGNVTGAKYYLGGFVGDNRGTITNCTAIGKVTGKEKTMSYYTGGFAGGNEGSITNCTSTGNITGNSIVGGFVGYNENEGIITNCKAIGNVNGKNISLDSFAGRNEGKIEDCKIA